MMYLEKIKIAIVKNVMCLQQQLKADSFLEICRHTAVSVLCFNFSISMYYNSKFILETF